MNYCILTNETVIDDHCGSMAVSYATTALRRDLRRKLGLEREATRDSGVPRIELRLDESDGAFDAHSIEVKPDGVTITGSDELGLQAKFMTLTNSHELDENPRRRVPISDKCIDELPSLVWTAFVEIRHDEQYDNLRALGHDLVDSLEQACNFDSLASG